MNRARVLIIADEKGSGGTNEVIKHLRIALYSQYDVFVDYINCHSYFSKRLPDKWNTLFRIFYLRNISSDKNFASYDLVISLQPSSHCIRHENHVVYFQHHLRQYYDLFWFTYNRKKGAKKKLLFALLTCVVRCADRLYLTPNLKNSQVIVNSDTVAKRLVKYNHISDFDIINPGCDLASNAHDNGYVSEVCKQIGMRNGRPLLLSFSRLDLDQKGIQTILDTASLMPTCSFIIAGPYHPTIEIISTEKYSNVNLLIKEFSNKEKQYLYKKCDVFLAPYINEDFGMAPLEANWFGKPVVYCTDSGEILNTQKHKFTGYMSKRDPHDMVKGIEYCISNKEMMRPLCIENASRFTWQNFEKSFRGYCSAR